MSEFVKPGDEKFKPEVCDGAMGSFYHFAEHTAKWGKQLDGTLQDGLAYKGCLNDDDFERRVCDAINGPDGELRPIIFNQNLRRFRYFSARLRLEHSLISVFEGGVQHLLRYGQWMRTRISDGRVYACVPGGDKVMAKAVMILKGDGNYLTALAKARSFVAEEDPTRGKGKEAFFREWKKLEKKDSPSSIWSKPALDVGLEVIQVIGDNGGGCHQELATLVETVILPTLRRYQLRVAQLNPLVPIPTNRNPVYEPSLTDRLNAEWVSDDLRCAIEWSKEAEKKLTAKISECRKAIADLSDAPSTWLLMSNVMGAHMVNSSVKAIGSDAHNLTVTQGGSYDSFHSFARTNFSSLYKQAEEMGLTVQA